MGITELFRLPGKVAIVTGASSGLGVSFARALAEAGAGIALGARRADRLEQVLASTREATGCRGIAAKTDVASPADCRRLVDAAIKEFGQVDILVNNAGVG
ncbi:MAG: hypothetical protein QOG28_5964, partial [Trebonia sp.]|nr:hypothetical protein [Trebonia sp.]